jgi:hypothetical protein
MSEDANRSDMPPDRFAMLWRRTKDHRIAQWTVGYVGLSNQFLWDPSVAALRKTERFKTYVRKVGFYEYWRAKGWPDLCHPTSGADFECG